MKQVTTQGIVLKRTDFGESDRIVKFLTPDHGKISVIARGVRKSKSKLAGSIELFSVSELTYIVGKGQVYTLISARLKNHYDNIVKDLERTNLGYEFINLIDKATAENPEASYFQLLESAFDSLNDLDQKHLVTELWFYMQLLKLNGHTPDLQTDTSNCQLSEDKNYDFDMELMRFAAKDGQGLFNSHHIKLLRIGFTSSSGRVLNKVKASAGLSEELRPFIGTLINTFVKS